ncbi:hypothetical protein LINPERPRIM_LOCUS554 [Linum perenne]
MFSMLSVLIGG